MNIELKAGSTYLIKGRSSWYSSSKISKIQIVSITETCYQIKFDGSKAEYIEKSNFNMQYDVIEELSNNLMSLLTSKNFDNE